MYRILQNQFGNVLPAINTRLKLMLQMNGVNLSNKTGVHCSCLPASVRVLLYIFSRQITFTEVLLQMKDPKTSFVYRIKMQEFCEFNILKVFF